MSYSYLLRIKHVYRFTLKQCIQRRKHLSETIEYRIIQTFHKNIDIFIEVTGRSIMIELCVPWQRIFNQILLQTVNNSRMSSG